MFGSPCWGLPSSGDDVLGAILPEKCTYPAGVVSQSRNWQGWEIQSFCAGSGIQVWVGYIGQESQLQHALDIMTAEVTYPYQLRGLELLWQVSYCYTGETGQKTNVNIQKLRQFAAGQHFK